MRLQVYLLPMHLNHAAIHACVEMGNFNACILYHVFTH